MKCLVFYDENMIKPVGGPAGYLFNLKKCYHDNSIQLDFLHSKVAKQNDSFVKKIYNKMPKIVHYIHCIKEENKRFKRLQLGQNNVQNISDYDIIHFHDCYSLYGCRNALKDYKGIVIFQSHTPVPSFTETFDYFNKLEKKVFAKRKNEYAEMLRYAFYRADIIIFPNEHADESYFNHWDSYESVKKDNLSKYRYLLTGCEKAKANISREDIRKQYNIPDNAFVFSYVGRHNQVKGYDVLKEIGNKVLARHINVYFIIAGKEEPIKGLNHPRWIEVGWTKESPSIVDASDFFILPNKETYFDLVLLEVLSIGKPVIASNTGGNKMFFNENGIMLYDNVSEALDYVYRAVSLDKGELKKLGEGNYNLYSSKFTSNIFADNYAKLLHKIIKEKTNGQH